MSVGTRRRLTALGLVEHLASWFFGGLYIPCRMIPAVVAWRGVWVTTLVLLLFDAGPCRAAWRLYLSLGAVSCCTYLVLRCICLVWYLTGYWFLITSRRIGSYGAFLSFGLFSH